MKKYLIATVNDQGGYDTRYTDYDSIKAEDGDEALELYNKKFNCNYFYGSIMATKDENDKIIIRNKQVTYNRIEQFKEC